MRTGGLGQGQHLFWRRILQSKIRNSAAARARARREFLSPQPPFLPAPPERSGLVFAARSAAIIRDFAQKRFELRSVIATNLNIANFASKQNISEFLKSLNWSQLLNKVRTYFERKILPLCVSAVLASRNQNKTILIPQPH